MREPNNQYKGHRFPAEIIQYAVWVYYRFNLSHRDIEDLLAARGITPAGPDPPLPQGEPLSLTYHLVPAIA